MPGPKMTIPTRLVVATLMEDPTREMYGLEICAASGLATGTIHPILARLEKAGWLVSRWETIDTSLEGRPRRRYYKLNPDALAHVQAAVHRADTKTPALARLLPRPAGEPS